MRRWETLLAVMLLLNFTHSELILNFDDNAPRVPTKDPDLVVELVWDFSFDNDKDGVVSIKWVPGSDQVITVQKMGTLRLYNSIDSDVTDYVTILDMTDEVESNADHGLIQVEFHPLFPVNPSIFVFYTGEPKDVSTLPNYASITPIRPPDFGPAAYTWNDQCAVLNLEDPDWDNLNGLICEHPYYIDRLTLDLATQTATKDITLMQTECGSGAGHGTGTLMLIGNDLVFSQGDGSQYSRQDFGIEQDGCYDPNAPDPGFQGSFRAQRDDSPNGKIHRIPYALLDSPTELNVMDMEVIVKGARNPWRIFHHEATDSLYAGDVGYGDGGTTERIFRHELVSVVNGSTTNFGWPCVEGVRASVLGPYALFDSPFEAERVQYVQDNGLSGCDAVYAAAETYVQTMDPTYVPIATQDGVVADPNWVPPLYEYRVGALDPNFPSECNSGTAAIINVHIYDGTLTPVNIQGKLMFADQADKCLLYFENGEDGLPDTTTAPTVLLANAAIIDMRTGADGYLYAVEWTHRRVIRMYQSGLGPSGGNTVTPTFAPGGVTMAPTAAFVAPQVEDAGTCFAGYGVPELGWVQTDANAYYGELTIGAANVVLPDGTSMRTRVWNGLLPGPIIRLKPCTTYNLRVINDMADWGSNIDGDINTMHNPLNTNLHLHGLHISGEAPGDNPFETILPGEFLDYTYNVPCDHVGGTHLYHTHYHGNVALQTDSGAAGMLIIEPSAREASDMPVEYQSMPELYATIQEFSPTLSTGWAEASGDQLFLTDHVDDFTLVNGCEGGLGDFTLEAGQWTKIRMLRSGLIYNAMLELVPTVATDAACDVVLLAKDGIPLGDLPRALPTGVMFMSLSSRIDIAVRCPTAGVTHILQQRQIGNPAVAADYREIVLSVTVLASERDAAADLPPYTPCRPHYLQDLEPLAVSLPEQIDIRQNFNGYLFEGPDAPPFAEFAIEETVTWLVTDSDLHPMHIHINHMQLGALSDGNQWVDVPDWHVQGDWLDTLSVPEIALIYIRPTEFVGTMLMHCHIAEHSDNGVMAINQITGDGYDGATMPVLVDYGTCNEVIPASAPYNVTTPAIPGTILATEFDTGGEGIAFHNVPIATNAGNSIRLDESVEIRSNVDGSTYVGYARAGEWLKYTVDTTSVTAKNMYSVYVKAYQAQDAAPAAWSIWMNETSCQAPGTTVNLLAQSTDAAPATRIDDPNDDIYDYFASSSAYATLDVADAMSILVCFDNTPQGDFALESITILVCGTTADECATSAGPV